MAYELRWEPRGVYRRYFDDVTIVQRRESFDRICADPRFDDLRFTITDYLGVRSYEITDDSTQEIAALHIGPARTNPAIAIAAVVVDRRIIAAIEHFMSFQFIELPYSIFETEALARRWIAEVRAGFWRTGHPGARQRSA